jgi:hypothetical protein
LDDADDLAAAVMRIEGEKARAEAEMVALAARREALLMADDDAGLDADERGSEKAYRVAEKCRLLLADLRPRIAAAKDAERQRRWRGLKSKYDAAAVEYANALRAAVEKMATVLNVNDEGRRQGFEREVMAHFIPPARMISADALNQYEVEIDRVREMARPRPAPAPSPAKPVPTAAAPTPAAKPKPVPKPQKAAAPKPAKPPFKPCRTNRAASRSSFFGPALKSTAPGRAQAKR